MSSIVTAALYNFADGAQGRVTFGYDAAEPLVIRLDFGYCRRRGMRVIWEVARDVLVDGLLGVAGLSDVCCWNSNEVYHIALSSPEGSATIRLAADAIRRVLIDAEDLVPYGLEVLNIDAELASLLGGG